MPYSTTCIGRVTPECPSASQQTRLPHGKVNLPIVNRTKVLFTMDEFACIFLLVGIKRRSQDKTFFAFFTR